MSEVTPRDREWMAEALALARGWQLLAAVLANRDRGRSRLRTILNMLDAAQSPDETERGVNWFGAAWSMPSRLALVAAISFAAGMGLGVSATVRLCRQAS